MAVHAAATCARSNPWLGGKKRAPGAARPFCCWPTPWLVEAGPVHFWLFVLLLISIGTAPTFAPGLFFDDVRRLFVGGNSCWTKTSVGRPTPRVVHFFPIE